MNISKSSKRWSTRLSCGLIGALTLGLCSFVSAQPEPPKNSIIAVKLKPWPETASKVDRRALLAHPVYTMVERLGKDALGFEPLKFIDHTFEGTFVAAVVAPESKSAPSLADFFDDLEVRENWSTVVRELDSLKDDLISYYGSAEGNYPASIDSYLDEIRYYSPGLPYGADYRYRVTNGGKGFELKAVFTKGSPLSKLGKPPLFTSDGERLNVEPTAAPVPLNLVMGAKIRDKSQLVEFLDKGFGPSKNGFWASDIDDKVKLVVTVRGDWVVAADQMSNLGGFIKSLNGTAPGWSKNGSFQAVGRNLDSGAPLFFFVDLPRILKSFDLPKRGPEAQLVKLFGPIGYAIKPYTESQFRLDIFMGVNPPKGSELAKYFHESAGMSGAEIDTSNIPWDANNVFAFDFRSNKELLDAVVALFPDLSNQYSMGQDVMAGILGLDAEAGFNSLFSGPAVVSFERIDILLNAIESWLTAAKSYSHSENTPPEESIDNEDFDLRVPVPEPSIEDGEDSATDSPADGQSTMESVEQPTDERGERPAEPETDPFYKETTEPGPGPFSFLPATLAVKVPIESNREAILKMLEPYMGDPTTEQTSFGVGVVTSQDGTISYAVDGEWMYLSSGRTERLAKYMLETAHGRRESLASIDSWSRFTLGTKGRVLGFGHQKVDAFYALAKGFLLFLGVEFRPMAEELGKLRDYHSVFTVVPEGLLISGEIVQGDGR